MQLNLFTERKMNTVPESEKFNQQLFATNLMKQLRDMREDVLLFLRQCVSDIDDEKFSRYLRDALNFCVGAFLCEKYVYDHINLETFIHEMIEEDLKTYVIELPHIPEHLAEKYNLYEAV